MSIELSSEGLNDLQNLCEEMQISDSKSRRALNAGLDIGEKAVVNNTPEKTGAMKSRVKRQITRIDGDMAGRLSVAKWYATFEDWGTSQNKKHVGFFERAIENCAEAIVEAMKNEVLK